MSKIQKEKHVKKDDNFENKEEKEGIHTHSQQMDI